LDTASLKLPRLFFTVLSVKNKIQAKMRDAGKDSMSKSTTNTEKKRQEKKQRSTS
jgi:hypothetical protein